MKYCIITGANSGIGRRAAFQIAERGNAVILACRNLEAAQKTCDEIKIKTGNENVYVIKVDLSIMSEVHSFITEYKKRFDRLDVLINNAADFDISRKKPKITAEGNEAQFATNVLAPHLLSIGLMDLLWHAPRELYQLQS